MSSLWRLCVVVLGYNHNSYLQATHLRLCLSEGLQLGQCVIFKGETLKSSKVYSGSVLSRSLAFLTNGKRSVSLIWRGNESWSWCQLVTACVCFRAWEIESKRIQMRRIMIFDKKLLSLIEKQWLQHETEPFLKGTVGKIHDPILDLQAWTGGIGRERTSE